MSYDALVVGSGPNGLTAAITLAQSGLRVLVLEDSERPGGAVASEELTLPGFTHDTFSAVHPAGAASPVFARLPLERHGLRWIHPPVCYAHPLADGSAVALYRDLDRTAAGLERVHAGDGERWRAFAEPFVAHFDALRETMLSGFPPIRGPVRLATGLGPRGMLDFVRLLLMPAQALAEELFESDGARAWLYSSAMHSDVSPRASGSAIAAAYLMLLGHGVGWPSPEGGAGRLAQALLAHLQGARRRGARRGAGRARARRPWPRRRRAARGRRAARRPRRHRRRNARRARHARRRCPARPVRPRAAPLPHRPGHAQGSYWALGDEIPWSAPEAREAGTVHVGGSVAEVLAGTTGSMGLPERPFMLVGQQSLADPTRAPAGRHTAWAYTHGPHTVDWAGERDCHVQRMEDQLERFAPGFRERVLARHVLAPGDLERRDANLVGGDVGGGSYTLDQVIFRPVPSLAPYRTPVRGLYIGSAATFPGGAVHGVPGRAAARQALAELRLTRLMPRSS